MAFKEAATYIEEHCDDRADDIKNTRRPTWHTSDFGNFSELIEMFNSDSENSKLIKLTKDGVGDINNLIGLRSQLAWLCGCRVDLRRQHAAGKAHVFRSGMHRMRYSQADHKLKAIAVARMRDLMVSRENSKITG